MKIGFIGTGVMGSPMALNLLKKGFDVSVYSRTRSKAEPLLASGAHWCDSVATCASGRDVVLTMVGYPKDVEEVYFSEGGILLHADQGTVLIDMTTSSPELSVRIYRAALQKGMTALDAPVSGGDVGAKNGTLSIMVGGDREVFNRMKDVFSAMGTNLHYQGPAGSGQHTKMANQIALSGCIAGVCEAIAYAHRSGLNLQDMLDAVSNGAAGSWQMTNNGKKILAEDFSPGFYVKHFIKDMNIALEEARARGLNLSMLQTVRDEYVRLAAQGGENDGTQALIQIIDQVSQEN